MRRPWMMVGLAGGSFGILVVALAPTVWVVLIGWCLAQLFFNAMLAAMVAVLPDQVPVEQRGTVAGVLGVCLPIASVGGTYVVKVFTGNELAMFLAPCAIGGFFIVVFALYLDDRRLAPADKPPWSLRQLLGTYYVSPRRHPDFAWAFASRFMFILAYAFLVTYQAYYLLDHLGSAEDEVPRADLPGHPHPGGRRGGRLRGGRSALGPHRPPQALRRGRRGRVRRGVVHDRGGGRLRRRSSSGWRSPASASACTWPSTSRSSPTCCPTADSAAKDLGVLNIAGALPFSIGPALAPLVLAIGSGSYQVLYAVAGVCALVGAAAILPVRRVR